MDSQLYKKILRLYFAGQATPLQKQLIAEWLKDDANQEVFYAALHEWEKENPQFLPDAEADLQRFLSFVDQTDSSLAEPQTISYKSKPVLRSFNWTWMIAASVALLVLVGWWQRNAIFYKSYSTAYGQVRTIHLPDNSRVTLNANSTLKVSRFSRFAKDREVTLAGEAEFSVTHTADHRRFLVHTPDQLEVEVLGTEFIVYSRNRGSKVVLNHGKVQLRSLKDKRRKPLTIRPGDVVTVDNKGTFQLRSQQPVAEHRAWTEHRFVFNRTPLLEIAQQVQDQFGVQVQIADTLLRAHQLSGNYQAQSADELLKMIAHLLNLKLEQQADKVVLLPKE